jgi:DNA mismatch repair protein MutS2
MLYPENIEQKLGFDKIKELVKNHCISTLGLRFVEKIKFSDDFKNISKLINQVAEFKEILQVEGGFPEQNYIDCNDSLQRAAIIGTFLQEDEFFDLKLSIKTIQSILSFFKSKEEGIYPTLRELSDGIDIDKSVIIELDKIIDDRGIVRESASPMLKDIRQRLMAEQNNLRKTLDRLLKTAKNEGWIGDEMSVSVRGGRMVIPVLAEHKRKIKGFLHDESASGQMLFIEPAEVLESNNEIKELQSRERREIVKILENLTTFLRPHVVELKRAYIFLGLIDFVRAKASFAIEINASAPQITNSQSVNWLYARHPLLFLSFKKQKKQTVPLNVRLNEENRILVVSGPNAGGKSIMLKTIGLLQYMMQCGLLVSLSPDSEMGVFKNVFIDIGDEQSLDNDLSTYSSHLTNMKHFLLQSNKFTLFLIDEFGTGTEPSLGGAIAESILEGIQKSNAFGVINTHYTNLKVFADKQAGLVNGAMKFDAEHLEPMYELDINKPGSSFAFEVAQKIGLPKEIIENAKKKLGTEQIDFEKLIKELDIEKKVFAERNTDLQKKNTELKATLEQYTAMKSFLDTQQKRLMNDAKTEAQNIVKEANRRIEATIKEIKEGKAEKEATVIARQNLKEFQEKELILEEVVPLPVPPSENDWQTEKGLIEVGSFVKIQGQTSVGEVIAVKGKDAEVRMGELRTTLKLNRLEKVSNKAAKQAKEKYAPKISGIDMNEKMTNFSFNLDIRGKRGEEALSLVDNLINDALMLSYQELRIVHGKGDGILRTLIRNHLKRSKFIASMSDEHADRGGAGVTIIKMK